MNTNRNVFFITMMFDVLKEIREQWLNGGKIVLIDDYNIQKSTYLVIPAQSCTIESINSLRQHGGQITAGISSNFAHHVGLEPLQTMFLGLSSRYSVISIMLQNIHSILQPTNFLPSISHISATKGLTASDLTITAQTLGDLADEFISKSPEKYSFQKKFASQFYIPGHLQITRALHGLMMKKVSVTELSLALCEISNQAPCTIYSPLLMNGEFMNQTQASEFASNEKLPIIDAKLVINLWRSIKKINKGKITLPIK